MRQKQTDKILKVHNSDVTIYRQNKIQIGQIIDGTKWRLDKMQTEKYKQDKMQMGINKDSLKYRWDKTKTGQNTYEQNARWDQRRRTNIDATNHKRDKMLKGQNA